MIFVLCNGHEIDSRARSQHVLYFTSESESVENHLTQGCTQQNAKSVNRPRHQSYKGRSSASSQEDPHVCHPAMCTNVFAPHECNKWVK